jgi:uncharacterized protein YegL
MVMLLGARRTTSSVKEEIARTKNYNRRELLRLIIDTSGSMAPFEEPLYQAQCGLKSSAVENRPLALRGRIAVTTVGGTVKCEPFIDLDQFEPKRVKAGGGTPLCEAIIASCNDIRAEKVKLSEEGVEVNKSAVVLLSDFFASDSAKHGDEACALVKACEEAERREERIAFFLFSTLEPNIDFMKKLSRRPVCHLHDANFDALFRWIGATLSQMSMSQLDEPVAVENPEQKGFGTFL